MAEATAEPRGRETGGRRPQGPPTLPFDASSAACHNMEHLMFPDLMYPWGNPLRIRSGRPRTTTPPPGYTAAIAAGIALCRSCVHLEACDDYAREAGPRLLPVGIYGGRPLEERRRIEAAKRARPPTP